MISRQRVVSVLGDAEDWILKRGGTNGLLACSALIEKLRADLLAIVDDVGETVELHGHVDMPDGYWLRRSDAHRAFEVVLVVPCPPGSTVPGDLQACGKVEAEAVLILRKAAP